MSDVKDMRDVSVVEVDAQMPSPQVPSPEVSSAQAALARVKGVLAKEKQFYHAASIINFDMESVCPPAGLDAQGELATMLSNMAFALRKEPAFVADVQTVIAGKEQFDGWDRVLADTLEREEKQERNLTPEKQAEFSEIYQKSWLAWRAAKEASDYGMFVEDLKKVRDANIEEVGLWVDALADPYDNLLSIYERGMTSAQIDAAFARCRERLVPLLRRIMASKKQIRTDFLSREVTEEQQRTFARYLLQTIGFDFNRGTFATSEHPFTDGIGDNDTRVTTHYYPTMFTSNMYSIIHEGGHALFDQNTPAESRAHFVAGNKTMGMHESVSRFYENILGRSRGFIHLIYPKFQEIFGDTFADVSEQELYEAVNLVQPSLIRTESDEFTYTLHIIIRYEMEKEIVAGTINMDQLAGIWADRYEQTLGVRPQTDAEGVLQDVHWSSGFGYFPTYALGNMYNAMYYQRMKKDLDVDACIAAGDFAAINAWMTSHVFAKADRLGSADWIKDITGKDFSPEPFLDYLEEKYSKLYEL